MYFTFTHIVLPFPPAILLATARRVGLSGKVTAVINIKLIIIIKTAINMGPV